MTLIELEIKSLYGYMDKNIKFHKDFNLLVGINGSGKTSVLNIINWLLQPSLNELCHLEFKEVNLTLELDKVEYKLTCKQSETDLIYQVDADNGDQFYPLHVDLHITAKQIKKDYGLKEIAYERYSRLTPSEDEKETWNFLKSIPKPNIIGLDRTLYIEEDDREYRMASPSAREKIRGSTSSTKPLSHVISIVNTEYRKRKNEILNLTNTLKNHLMLSAFEGNLTVKSLTNKKPSKLTLDQVISAEIRVNSYFDQFEKEAFSPQQKKSISKYFEEIKEIIELYSEDSTRREVSLLYELNANQFSKINNLLRQFEKFEQESVRILNKIKTFLSSLNHFFKDSAKELIFKEDTSEIFFNVLDKHGKLISEYNNLNFLSSGEQQIFILFSYLAFGNEDGRLFIIDEPELSLHIKWQEDFLDFLSTLSPQNTQIIIATHSPILVAKRKRDAILLLPYNN